MRYLKLAEELRSEILSGGRRPAGLIDSESRLAARHGVSRDTVRRALERLRQEGLVASRQGFGWYMAADPVRQTLGTLTTIEAALAEAGWQPSRKVLEFGAGPPPAWVKEALRTRGRVLRVRRLNLADGHPFALVTVWARSELGPLTAESIERHTFYELLAHRGVELGRARKTVTADLAAAADAALLEVRPGSPLLVCRRVTHEAGGRAVLASEHLYPAHRIEFCVEVPRADPTGDLAPPGVRLVKGSRHA